jgi:hypothetical protein
MRLLPVVTLLALLASIVVVLMQGIELGLRPRICGTHQQARASASSTTRQAISSP